MNRAPTRLMYDPLWASTLEDYAELEGGAESLPPDVRRRVEERLALTALVVPASLDAVRFVQDAAGSTSSAGGVVSMSGGGAGATVSASSAPLASGMPWGSATAALSGGSAGSATLGAGGAAVLSAWGAGLSGWLGGGAIVTKAVGVFAVFVGLGAGALYVRSGELEAPGKGGQVASGVAERNLRPSSGEGLLSREVASVEGRAIGRTRLDAQGPSGESELRIASAVQGHDEGDDFPGVVVVGAGETADSGSRVGAPPSAHSDASVNRNAISLGDLRVSDVNLRPVEGALRNPSATSSGKGNRAAAQQFQRLDSSGSAKETKRVSDLKGEVELLRQARAARERYPGLARQILADYDRRYPRGALRAEYETLRTRVDIALRK